MLNMAIRENVYPHNGITKKYSSYYLSKTGTYFFKYSWILYTVKICDGPLGLSDCASFLGGLYAGGISDRISSHEF